MLRTLVSWQTVSTDGINKNKGLASAQVFGLPSSTRPFGLPRKCDRHDGIMNVDFES